MSGAICWWVWIPWGEQSAFFFKCNIILKFCCSQRIVVEVLSVLQLCHWVSSSSYFKGSQCLPCSGSSSPRRKALQSHAMSTTTWPGTQHHFPAKWNLQYNILLHFISTFSWRKLCNELLIKIKKVVLVTVYSTTARRHLWWLTFSLLYTSAFSLHTRLAMLLFHISISAYTWNNETAALYVQYSPLTSVNTELGCTQVSLSWNCCQFFTQVI
jgi:hypothetical protein